jgi:hypothetical protein
MGLFDVFMPMLYGEGARAFIRLQEEIIKQTEDSTIFAWRSKHALYPRGILAHSPSEFSVVESEHMIPLTTLNNLNLQLDQYSPPVLTSRGLVLSLPVFDSDSDRPSYQAWVACSVPKNADPTSGVTVFCIRLREVQSSPRVFVRIFSNTLESRKIMEGSHFKQRTLCAVPSYFNQFPKAETPKFSEIVFNPPKNDEFRGCLQQVKVSTWAKWRPEVGKLSYGDLRKTCLLAAITFKIEASCFMLVVGSHKSLPWCSIIPDGHPLYHSPTSIDLDDLSYMLDSITKYTDRAREKISATKCVFAAIRVAVSTDPNYPKYSLHVGLSEPSLEDEILRVGLSSMKLSE